MIYATRDSRDIRYDTFGQTSEFPAELIYDTTIQDFLQPIGDVRCTAITICEIARDMNGIEYDIDDLFNRIPNDKNGANPRDVLKECLKGLLPKGHKDKTIVFNSYWQAHTGRYDAFDNVRSAIAISQGTVAMWSPWFREWLGQSILPKGQNILNNHMYQIEGWVLLNGEPHIQIDAWLGTKMYMSRDVFNHVMSFWTSGTAVLSPLTINPVKERTILQTIVDLLKSFIGNYKIRNMNLKNKAIQLQGKRLTLDTKVPIALGCAQAVSYVLRECGYPIPKGGISGTYSLYEWLRKHFEEVGSIEDGDILISITGTGNGTTRGHVGVVVGDMVYSNNSTTGKWDNHWTIPKWNEHYLQKGGLRTLLFRPKYS